MTPITPTTYLQSITKAEQAHDVEMWRAAQTVRARVSDPAGRDELLGALGLLEAVRPAGL